MAISVSRQPRRKQSAPLESQYTQKQVAELLGVGESTVRKWISEGKLKAYRYGPRLIRVDAADLRKFREQVNPSTWAHVSGDR